MSREPIFIVGVPRSGTTLLASLLSAHSRMACGPETAFFASLAAAGGSLPGAGRWPDDATSFAESARLEDESLLERFAVGPKELHALLANSPPSPVAVLEALGKLTAERAGKARWIEKSPIHLLYVREIRSWFPTARIVRIVRDPRDVARSLSRVPWAPDDLLGALLYWRRFHEGSREFFGSDPLSHTVRYEDLVADAWTTVSRICGFLDEVPEREMLAEGRPTEGLVRASESWKGKVGGSIDPTRSERWRGWPEPELRLADAVVGDCLRELDYPLASPGLDHGWIWLHPRHEVASANGGVRRRIGEGARLWPAAPTERATAGVLIGEPDRDDWLGRRSAERLRTAATIVWRALGLRLRGRPVEWHRRKPEERGGGWSSRLLSLALWPLTSRGASGS